MTMPTKGNNDRFHLATFAREYYKDSNRKNGWKFSAIKNAINSLSVTNEKEKEFVKFIDLNFENIIIGDPFCLEGVISEVDQHFPNLLFAKGKQTVFGQNIEQVFAYTKFRYSERAKKFAQKLNIKTCLYCNTQSTLIIEKQKKVKLLFQFDHFYAKKKYPFLSVSMYNLIPCCGSCNISKSMSDFKCSDSFHPYEKDINTAFKFEIDNADIVKFILNRETSSSIKINIDIKDQRVQKHVDTFHFDKIVNEHVDVIEELFLKAYHYNETKRQELINEFNGLIDTETIMRFILGNYYLDKDLHRRPLAKLVKDVAKQINLL